MHTPSMSDTTGTGYSAIRALSRYSEAKNRSLASASPARLCSRIVRMSPPAQNAFVLALASTTADSGVRSHSASTRSRATTMSVVRALSALGRFSRIRPTPRWTSARISTAAVSVMGQQHLVVRTDSTVVAIMFLTRPVSGVDLRVEILDLVHGGYDG